ncbi:MAG: site-2 protease family protein, partial [Oscillospiraceae bacterium]|nr:site-2 protease family protein [Oscillospiraceae bacterium]
AFSSRPSVISFAAANLFIGIVNLIPAKGLDGGEVLFGILLRMTPVKNAEAIATAVSLLCAAPAVAAGLYVLSRNPGNFSLLMVGLWLIAGVIKEYIN